MRWSGAFDRSTLVLTSLAEGPKHGHALIKDVATFCGVELGPGTLYQLLSKLERDGLIVALPADGRRNPYGLTAEGKAVLRDRLAEAETISRVGLARLTAVEARQT